jgi:NAD+ diphosphatase
VRVNRRESPLETFTGLFEQEGVAIQDNAMTFIPAIHPPAGQGRPAVWFIFDKNRLLVKSENGTCSLPDSALIAASGLEPVPGLFLGVLGEHLCYAAGLRPDDAVPASCEWMDLRGLPGAIGEDLFWIAGRANHLLDWDRSHRFCGQCGHPTEDKSDERAKRCPACGLVNYPRLSPAVIVAVVKGDRILLARNKRFRGRFYSVLAGFVEPGETLEQCVQREIHEEVGLSVKNIRYFGSQPWPFPNSLMVGFVADYAGGSIVVDNSELMEAGWFAADALPNLPLKISIARRLIDWFVSTRNVP